MYSTIRDFKGKLYAVDQWERLTNGKEEIQRRWPLALSTAEHPELVAERVTYEGNGVFRLMDRSFAMRTVRMKRGADTVCEVTIRPIEGKEDNV